MPIKVVFIALTLFSIIFPAFKIGGFSREEEKLKDIRHIGSLIPNHEVINCSHKLLEDWSLQTYLSRYYFISLDINTEHDYFLCDKQEYKLNSKKYSENYITLPSELNNYYLLKHK